MDTSPWLFAGRQTKSAIPTYSPSISSMAASNCMSRFHSCASGINAPPQSRRAGRASLEVAIVPSSAICSSPSRHRGNVTILRWDSPCGRIRNSKRNNGNNFRYRASIVGEEQQEEGESGSVVSIPRKAADVVQEFYFKINQRDYEGVAGLFAEECVYEDFNFPSSKKGKEEVLKFFQRVMSSFGTELKFVIDDMTWDDPNAVGVIWHLDWRGKAFPFSRGCSFYRCVVNSSGERQISFARDIVEPATKPGDVSMGALRLVTLLFERFPRLAERL